MKSETAEAPQENCEWNLPAARLANGEVVEDVEAHGAEQSIFGVADEAIEAVVDDVMLDFVATEKRHRLGVVDQPVVDEPEASCGTGESTKR